MADEYTREEKKSRLRRRLIDMTQPEDSAAEDVSDAEGRSTEQLDRDLRAYQRRKRLIILLVIVLIAAAAAALVFHRKNRVYTEAEVLEELELPGAAGARYASYRDGALKVTLDGAAYVNAAGQTVWSVAYTMKDPMIEVCGSYAAIADRMGNDLVICREDGTYGAARTALPITRISVSQAGVTAVVLEDPKASYIEIYGADGARLDIEIKALLSKSGYPMDVAISPNGQILAVAYTYFEDGNVKNQVVFYNFDEEGKEYVDRVVGGFKEYEEMMVGDVVFLSDQTAVVFATGRVDVYSLRRSNEPSLRSQIAIEDEIRAVSYGHGRFAVLTQPADSKSQYRVTVYEASGDQAFSYDPEFRPEVMELTEQGLLLYSGTSLTVLRPNGKVRYDGDLGTGSRFLVQTGADRLLQMTEMSMHRLRLK